MLFCLLVTFVCLVGWCCFVCLFCHIWLVLFLFVCHVWLRLVTFGSQVPDRFDPLRALLTLEAQTKLFAERLTRGAPVEVRVHLAKDYSSASRVEMMSVLPPKRMRDTQGVEVHRSRSGIVGAVYVQNKV